MVVYHLSVHQKIHFSIECHRTDRITLQNLDRYWCSIIGATVRRDNGVTQDRFRVIISYSNFR